LDAERLREYADDWRRIAQGWSSLACARSGYEAVQLQRAAHRAVDAAAGIDRFLAVRRCAAVRVVPKADDDEAPSPPRPNASPRAAATRGRGRPRTLAGRRRLGGWGMTRGVR